MYLERVREHDQYDNGGAAYRASDRRDVLRNDVSNHIVSEGEVSSDGDKDVDAGRAADGSDDNRCSAGGTVVLDLVQDGEHLCLLAMFLAFSVSREQCLHFDGMYMQRQ